MTWTMDNRHAEQWLREQEPESADALITDPPYCSGGMSSSTRRSPSANSKYVDSKDRYPEFHGESRDQRSWIRWSRPGYAGALRKGCPWLYVSGHGAHSWQQYPEGWV